jgi:hypothetical protein
MQNNARLEDNFVFTYAALRPYLGRVLLNVSHVDWRDLQEASYVLEDVREALDACADFVKREGTANAEEQLAALEHVFHRLQSAESAPSIHRPHAGVKLARDFGDFVATYYITAPSDDANRAQRDATRSATQH